MNWPQSKSISQKIGTISPEVTYLFEFLSFGLLRDLRLQPPIETLLLRATYKSDLTQKTGKLWYKRKT